MRISTKLMATVALSTLMALPATTGNAAIDELIVSARKREENIQDVPLSVSAFGSDSIERLQANTVADLSRAVAGLVFTGDGARSQERPVLRGQANILGESGVAYFINGIRYDGSINTINLDEVERVEVIKGPQSALYGRNTYAGAINVITKKPGDEFTANAKFEIAEHGQSEIAGGISGPLVEGLLAGGLYARLFEKDGEYQTLSDGSDVGSQEDMSFSGTLRLTPNESWDINLRAVYAEFDDGPQATFLQPGRENNCFEGAYYCGEVRAWPVTRNDNEQMQTALTGIKPGQRRDSWEGSLDIAWDINDQVSLRSITGYYNANTANRNDIDYLDTSFQVGRDWVTDIPAAIQGELFPGGAAAFFTVAIDATDYGDVEETTWSQEIRLDFEPNDRMRFLLGGLYYENQLDSETFVTRASSLFGDSDVNPHLNAALLAAVDAQGDEACSLDPTCFLFLNVGSTVDAFYGFIRAGDRSETTTTNWAVFGSAEFDLTEAITATAELRYQEEEVEKEAGDDFTPLTVTEEAKFDALLPRFSLSWDIAEQSTLYGVVAKGTKPGNTNGNLAALGGFAVYDEEEVWAYELGIKNVLFDDQLIFNASAYYNDIEGYQLTRVVDLGGGASTSATINAGDARVWGIELEAVYSPAEVEGLTLTTNYTYSDPEFTSGEDDNIGLLLDIADNMLADGSYAGFGPDGLRPAPGSLDGKQIPRTSEHQFFAGLDYRGALTERFDWTGGVNVSYNSERFAQVLNYAEWGEATLVNANIGIAGDNFSLSLWGKNLTEEDSAEEVFRYRDFDVRNPFSDDQTGSTRARAFAGQLRPGRQFGITARISY